MVPQIEKMPRIFDPGARIEASDLRFLTPGRDPKLRGKPGGDGGDLKKKEEVWGDGEAWGRRGRPG